MEEKNWKPKPYCSLTWWLASFCWWAAALAMVRLWGWWALALAITLGAARAVARRHE